MSAFTLLICLLAPTVDADLVVTPIMYHLRASGPPEWSDFAIEPEAKSLRVKFQAEPNAKECSLRLRQKDVKETWRVAINGKQIGRLVQDENPMTVWFRVPAGTLVKGENSLVVEQTDGKRDDVMAGDATIFNRPLEAALKECTVEVNVADAKSGAALPCRLTIVDSAGMLATVGAESSKGIAVRPGVVYSGTGSAKFGLPAGEYLLVAGRGFEYGIASIRLKLKAGETIGRRLSLRREVDTEGFVSCDTHVHTLTGSGHGDCTLDERMATLAGEGIELAITTEHNKQDDWRAAAIRQGVERHFTPVVGNEVTTDLGHFNVFPLPAGGPLPDHRAKSWDRIFQSIEEKGGANAVVILNHARDRHANFAPFGLERHVSVAGEDLDGWKLRANAMEVINSGAQRNNVMDLALDWMGMLNAGVILTPIGSSDSHDVSRYIVGQGRTYIQCDDSNPQAIDMAKAVEGLRAGRVTVGCGLLATIKVNDKHGPGDLAPASDTMKVAAKVLGPSWTKSDRVELYANGVKIREEKIENPGRTGVHWSGEWTLPKFKHDTWLTVVATGPGVTELYWPIAKPYQPTSPKLEPRLIAVTGAVWIDSDGDGKRSSAADYARRIIDSAGKDLSKLLTSLAVHDEAVAIQSASLLHRGGQSVFDAKLKAAFAKAGPHAERGFKTYADAWRESQIARVRAATERKR